MTTFRTFDRTVALRCKLALGDGSKITVSYEASTGWNQVSGTVHSVLKLNALPFKPCWEITITDSESDR
jgi:hypothetical protein